MKELNEKNAITKEDVTQEMVDRCFSKVKGYEKSIKSVVKELHLTLDTQHSYQM